MAIKDILKNRRIELGLTLEQVAEKVGTSKQTIQRYETGVISNIPSDKIEALATALHTTPQYIMGWTENDIYQKTPYYLDDEAAKIAQELYERPELKTLFKAAQNVSSEDLNAVKTIIDSLAKKEED